MKIGHFTLKNNVFLAPMAGITDLPFRRLCKRLGAGYTVSEMLSSNQTLRNTLKTQRRIQHDDDDTPVAMQITGTEATEVAKAALQAIEDGAQIIDINMGCPAKKVCRKLAGSALMKDEKLALSIIDATVRACTPHQVPVTLKIRTGWDEQHKNAHSIALAAEQAGISMLTVHGRTREQKYHGDAEYDTVSEIKKTLQIPVVVNGDIDSAQKAKEILEKTQANAVMIGRAAQVRPWIFQEINHYMSTNQLPPPPTVNDVWGWFKEYLVEHYAFYDEDTGVRHARKHITWLINGLPNALQCRQQINQAKHANEQLEHLEEYITQHIAKQFARWPI